YKPVVVQVYGGYVYVGEAADLVGAEGRLRVGDRAALGRHGERRDPPVGAGADRGADERDAAPGGAGGSDRGEVRPGRVDRRAVEVVAGQRQLGEDDDAGRRPL